MFFVSAFLRKLGSIIGFPLVLINFFFVWLPFFSKQRSIILKKVGKIGGDERQVRTRLRHILSRISKEVEFSISDVKVRGSTGGNLPPIYEVELEDPDSAETLRKAFSRFTRKKNPVSRPPELDGVEVHNSVTLATRVRISILRVSWFFIFIK